MPTVNISSWKRNLFGSTLKVLTVVWRAVGAVVLGFDRGGFCFETFDALDREGFFYVGWVPATVKLPDLSSVAPSELEALIRAPGTVRFGTDEVQVTLELPLPPQPHARLAQGLVDLDKYGLLFVDGRRRLMFRLAPRPTRQALPSAGVLQEPPENSN